MASRIYEQPKTPPLPTHINSPSTPLFGTFDDDYQPYSPRKSSRISQRSRSAQTPPPQTSSSGRNRTNPSTSGSSTSSYATSQPRSPQTAPKKRGPKASPEIGGRRVSGALNYASTASAAEALGLPTPTPKKTEKTSTRMNAVRGAGMLPTPSKTPVRRPEDGKTTTEVASIARNLFPARPETVEEVMPSPKRKGKKRYTGFTLDSFVAEEDDAPIPIYTDSSERIPEVDTSMDNPFYGEGAEYDPDPSQRTVKRRKIMVPGEGEQDLEDVQKRKDGVVYVFRGRKVFRKFSDKRIDTRGDTGSFASEIVGDEHDDELDALLQARGSTLHAPGTESSNASRLLFPSERQLRSRSLRSQAVEDEEADTDIEVSTPHKPESKKISNSTPHINEPIATPMAPRFSARELISPPTTDRATRSKKIDLSSSPAGLDSDEDMSSIFHNWQTVKNPKRRGSVSMSPGRSKRIRST